MPSASMVSSVKWDDGNASNSTASHVVAVACGVSVQGSLSPEKLQSSLGGSSMCTSPWGLGTSLGSSIRAGFKSSIREAFKKFMEYGTYISVQDLPKPCTGRCASPASPVSGTQEGQPACAWACRLPESFLPT